MTTYSKRRRRGIKKYTGGTIKNKGHYNVLDSGNNFTRYYKRASKGKNKKARTPNNRFRKMVKKDLLFDRIFRYKP